MGIGRSADGEKDDEEERLEVEEGSLAERLAERGYPVAGGTCHVGDEISGLRGRRFVAGRLCDAGRCGQVGVGNMVGGLAASMRLCGMIVTAGASSAPRIKCTSSLPTSHSSVTCKRKRLPCCNTIVYRPSRST